MSTVVESENVIRVINCILLSKSRDRVAEVIVDLGRAAGSEPMLMNMINKLLMFDLLKNKQYQCQNLFEIVLLLL